MTQPQADVATEPTWMGGGVARRSFGERIATRRNVRLTLQRQEDPLLSLKAQLAKHIRVLRASVLDLQSKVDYVRTVGNGPGQGFPGLPTDLDPAKAVNGMQREVIQVLREVGKADLTSTVHYSLACLWARDYRMRTPKDAAALTICARHLREAVKDAVYLRGWEDDPDLRPLKSQLRQIMPQTQSPPVQDTQGGAS